MAMSTEYPHIVRDPQGDPLIEGTMLKVAELVVEKLAYGWSPGELHLQHPYLTLAQIYAARACYWDHREELDREIAERRSCAKRPSESIRVSRRTSNSRRQRAPLGSSKI
ncbi:MAG: hypothetical protein C4326_02930 [Ignavibacteria bacterium]